MDKKFIAAIYFAFLANIAHSAPFQVRDINGSIYTLGPIAQPSDICSILGNETFKYYKNQSANEFFTFPGTIAIQIFADLPSNVNSISLTPATATEITNNIRQCLAQLVQQAPDNYRYAMAAKLDSGRLPNVINRGYLDGDNRIPQNFAYFPIILGYKDGYPQLIADLNSRIPLLKAKFDDEEKIKSEKQDAIDRARAEQERLDDDKKNKENERIAEAKSSAMWSNIFDNFKILIVALASGALAWFFRSYQTRNFEQIKSKALMSNKAFVGDFEFDDENESSSFMGDIKKEMQNRAKNLTKLEGWFDLSEGKSTGLLGQAIRNKVERDKSKNS